MSIGLLGLIGAGASAETVMAPVVEAAGSVSGAFAGTPKAGTNLSVGDVISTKDASRVTISPFPGGVISFAAKTQGAISRLEMSKQGDSVTRQAAVALKEGTLFLAVEKVNWSSTVCEITTPGAKMTAQRPDAPATATIAVAGVHKGQQSLAVQVGKGSCEVPGGQPIFVTSGCVLASTKDGFSVVDIVHGKVATYNKSGATTGSRDATAAELKKAANTYAAAAQLSQALIVSGAVSPSMATAMSESLTSVNEHLVSAGIKPVNTDSVGSLPSSSGAEASLPSLSGLGGAGGANPANTRGLVRSPAK